MSPNGTAVVVVVAVVENSVYACVVHRLRLIGTNLGFEKYPSTVRGV